MVDTRSLENLNSDLGKGPDPYYYFSYPFTKLNIVPCDKTKYISFISLKFSLSDA